MTSSKAEIIRAIFAPTCRTIARSLEDALTDDFRFTSPYDDESTRRPISTLLAQQRWIEPTNSEIIIATE